MSCMVDGAAPAQHAADTQPLRTLYKAFYRGRRRLKRPLKTHTSRFFTHSGSEAAGRGPASVDGVQTGKTHELRLAD
jgi:hypothetical protein